MLPRKFRYGMNVSWLLPALVFYFITTTCSTITPKHPLDAKSTQLSVRVPSQSEWLDYGTIIEAGAKGEWDHFLWGGFALSAIKKDGIYYLYYQGASDFRTEYDQDVMWRAIGVATSTDGIHFSKYEGNPILTWFPNQYGEEGAVSSGVTVGEQGEIILFYGANTREGATSINADIRMASSSDGLNFEDRGVALHHRGLFVWGRGDELFPVDAIYDSGRWIVYYIPNGTTNSGLLGVAHGQHYDALQRSSAVRSGGKPISVWGPAGHAKVGQDLYALILNNHREETTEVRLVSLNAPAILSEPVAVYDFDEVLQAVLLLDEEKKMWFMYYYDTNWVRYGVKVAPASIP
jgi:hypothetical protein